MSNTNQSKDFCRFPDCKCPMDPGPAPDWCAIGLPHARASANQSKEEGSFSGDLTNGECDAGERCSCPPGSAMRAKCTLWHSGEQKPTKVFGLLIEHKEQKPLIEKHCFGDCGKISMAGAIVDPTVGGLFVCCEEKCPWLGKQMDEPYGTTMSFGRPHEVYLRVLTDTPSSQSEAR